MLELVLEDLLLDYPDMITLVRSLIFLSANFSLKILLNAVLPYIFASDHAHAKEPYLMCYTDMKSLVELCFRSD